MTDDSPDNQDRADRVSGFVRESCKERYWGGEYIETVVQDIISDLLHFLDRADEYINDLDNIHRDEAMLEDPNDWHDLIVSAESMYIEERDEEAWEKKYGENAEEEEEDAATASPG